MVSVLARPMYTLGPTRRVWGAHEIVEQALVHAVALVHESLVVAVYPDNAGSRKLKIDDGVEGQSQCCGEDPNVQPRALIGVVHSQSCQ
jgi:hypothetical protein